ncbi:hypothetical protein D3C71_677550 [compost metagenome]
MAVAQARKKAPNTRDRLASACSVSVELATPSVMAKTNLSYTAMGDGRNSGLTQPAPVTRNHSAISARLVSRLMWPL